jgi:hypothetical protein
VLTIDDIEPLVAQKTVTLLETLSEQAVKSILSCFEFQFDCVIADRLFLNKIINKFYSCMLSINNNRSTTLSWEFFLQRFNSISMESQLVNDILSPVDISGVNVNNNNTQRRINMARLALKRSDLIKSVTADLQHVFNPNIFHYKMSQSEKTGQSKRSTSKTSKSAKATPVKQQKKEDAATDAEATTTTPAKETTASGSKTSDKTDKLATTESKDAAANTKTRGKEAAGGGGMSSGMESDNTQTNANTTPDETDAELVVNDDNDNKTSADTGAADATNKSNKAKQPVRSVVIEEGNNSTRSGFGADSNDAASELIDTAKEQESVNNEIIHSLVTLLMKVSYTKIE